MKNSTRKFTSGFFGLNLISFSLIILSLLFFNSQNLFAHCDSYDGPVIKDAQEALENNNVNMVLKWVSKDQEDEIKSLFKKTYNLRNGDKEVYEIVQKHFFETLVRLHRETEGEPFTGLKPAGSTSKILGMADNTISTGKNAELKKTISSGVEKTIQEKFEKLMTLSKVKDDSVEKGREYVAAYIDYTHTLEALHSILEKNDIHHSGKLHKH
jgi:hypothetical protein